MGSSLKIGHLIVIFALAALPLAATFTLYYPDERHYTDGALYMLQHGDWLSPHTGAGDLRFEKPILAYWAVAGSWEIFGVHVLAARLPFLLLSCGTLWLTYCMARRFTASNQIALLAAIILASQPQFFLSAVRNIPDALLTFFVTLSAYGFLRLLALNELSAGAYWMAYLGAAGAALSKGLLGVGIVLFCWGFAFLPKRDWPALKKLWHWPSLLTAFALVSSWFIYIIAEHGTPAWHCFFGDQVTGNIHGHVWTPLLRIPVFTLTVLVNFLPWSLVITESFIRRNKIPAGAAPAMIRKFVVAWASILVVGFSIGSNISLRYTLPALPLLAIAVADWLAATDQTGLLFSLRRILMFLTTVFCLACGCIVLTAYQWHMPMLVPTAAALLLFALLLGLGAGTIQKNYLPLPEAIVFTVLAGWLVLIAAALPILPMDSGLQTAEALKKEPGGPRPVLVIDNVQLANRLRLQLGPRWSVAQAPQLPPNSLSQYKYFVLPQNTAQEFANHGWRVREITVEPSISSLRELWAAVQARAVPEYLDGHGRKFYLAAGS